MKKEIKRTKRIKTVHKALLAFGALGMTGGLTYGVTSCGENMGYDFQVTIDRESSNVNYFISTGTEQTTGPTMESFIAADPSNIDSYKTGAGQNSFISSTWAQTHLWPLEMTNGWNIPGTTSGTSLYPWTTADNIANQTLQFYVESAVNTEAGATRITTYADLSQTYKIDLSKFPYRMGTAKDLRVYLKPDKQLDHVDFDIRDGLHWGHYGDDLGAVTPEDFLTTARGEMDTGYSSPYTYMYQLNTNIVNSFGCASSNVQGPSGTNPGQPKFFNSQECKDYFGIDSATGKGIKRFSTDDAGGYNGENIIQPTQAIIGSPFTIRLTYFNPNAGANQGKNVPLNMAFSMYATQLYWPTSVKLLSEIGGSYADQLFDSTSDEMVDGTDQFMSLIAKYGTSDDTWAGIGPYVMDNWILNYIDHFSKNNNYWNKDSVLANKFQIRLGSPAPVTVATMFKYGYINEAFLGNEFEQSLKNYNGSKNLVGNAPAPGVTDVQVWNTADRVDLKDVDGSTPASFDKLPLNQKMSNDSNFRLAMRYAINTSLYHTYLNKPQQVGTSIYSDLSLAAFETAPDGNGGSTSLLNKTAATTFMAGGSNTKLNATTYANWSGAFGNKPIDPSYSKDSINNSAIASVYWQAFLNDPVGKQLQAAKNVVLNVITSPAKGSPTAISQTWGQALTQLGAANLVTLKINSLATSSAFFQQFYGANAGGWDMAFLSWNPDYNDPLTFYSTNVISDPTINSNESGTWSLAQQALTSLNGPKGGEDPLTGITSDASAQMLFGDPSDPTNKNKVNPQLAALGATTPEQVANAVLNSFSFKTASGLIDPKSIDPTGTQLARPSKESEFETLNFGSAYWAASALQKIEIQTAYEILIRAGAAVTPVNYGSQAFKGNSLIGTGINFTGQEDFAFAYNCKDNMNGLPGCDSFGG